MWETFAKCVFLYTIYQCNHLDFERLPIKNINEQMHTIKYKCFFLLCFFCCKLTIIFWLVLSHFIERHVAGMWPSLMCTSALIKPCVIYQQQTNSSLSPVTSAENIQWGHIHDCHVLPIESQVHHFIQFLHNWFNKARAKVICRHIIHYTLLNSQVTDQSFIWIF